MTILLISDQLKNSTISSGFTNLTLNVTLTEDEIHINKQKFHVELKNPKGANPRHNALAIVYQNENKG